jgi:hypothetical protein
MLPPTIFVLAGGSFGTVGMDASPGQLTAPAGFESSLTDERGPVRQPFTSGECRSSMAAAGARLRSAPPGNGDKRTAPTMSLRAFAALMEL